MAITNKGESQTREKLEKSLQKQYTVKHGKSPLAATKWQSHLYNVEPHVPTGLQKFQPNWRMDSLIEITAQLQLSLFLDFSLSTIQSKGPLYLVMSRIASCQHRCRMINAFLICNANSWNEKNEALFYFSLFQNSILCIKFTSVMKFPAIHKNMKPFLHISWQYDFLCSVITLCRPYTSLTVQGS